MAVFKLLIHSARQIVQVVNNNQLVCKGAEMNELAILEDDKGCSIVVDRFVQLFCLKSKVQVVMRET